MSNCFGAIFMPSALIFLGVLLGGCLVVLSQQKTQSVFLAALSAIFAILCSFATRLTSCPQSVLGLASNAGALLGSTATVGLIRSECAFFMLVGGV